MKNAAAFYRCSLSNHLIQESCASKSAKRLTHYLLTFVLLSCSAELRSQPLPTEYLAAEQALSAGRLKTGDSLLTQLITRRSPLPRAYQRLAESYIDRDSVPEGIRRFENFLTTRPGDANAHAGLAMLYNSTGKADSALAHGLSAVRGGAPIIPACEITVHIARAQKQDDLLNAQLQARLKEKPNDLAAGYTQIYVAYADGRLKDAAEQLDALQKHFPRDWRLFHLRSIVEVEFLPIDKVLSSIQKGLSFAKSAGDNEGIACMLFRQIYAYTELLSDVSKAELPLKQLNTMTAHSEKVGRLAALAVAMHDQTSGNLGIASEDLKKLRSDAMRKREGITAYWINHLLGRIYYILGNFSLSENFYSQAKAIADSLRFMTLKAAEDTGLGFALERLGEYPAANDHYEEAERLALKIGSHRYLGFIWSGIARRLLRDQDYVHAIEFQKKQIALSRMLRIQDQEVEYLSELAHTYLYMDSLSLAKITLDEAWKKSLANKSQSQIKIKFFQGDLAKKMGEYDQARNAYDEAGALAALFESHDNIAYQLRIGDLSLALHDCAGAEEAYRMAHEKILQRVINQGSEKGQLDLAASSEAIISFVKGLVSCGKFRDGFEKARQSRLLALREFDVARDRALRVGGEQASALIMQIDSLRAALSNLDRSDSTMVARRIQIETRIYILTQQLNDLQKSGAADSLWLNRFLENPFPLSDLQKALADQNAVALVYLVGDNCAISFAIHSDTLVSRLIPTFSKSSLRRLVKRLNPLLAFEGNMPLSEALKSRLQFDLNRGAARELVDTFVNPLLLGRQPKKLIIMPDDVLCALPFDVLLLAADSKSKSFEQLPRIQIGLDFRDIFHQKILDSARTLIMANSQPVELDGGDNLMLPLEFVISEAKKIYRILHSDSSRLLCDEYATRKAFKDEAGEFDILHLAMHANLSDWSPEYAQLYFGSPNGNSEAMYAYEVTQMRLPARLTVLSACNTALGHYRPGFGLLSFVLNFMDAGVPSVVATLWQVDTKTTEILMSEFYEQLSKGKSYSEALAMAKQHLIEEGYTDPYY